MRRERLILVLAAYAAAYFLLMRLPGDILQSPIGGSDLSSYYTAGWLVRNGQADRLYDVAPGDTILGDATSGPYRVAADRLGIARQHYYIYPPFFAVAAAPLSFLPFGAARLAWLALDLAMGAGWVVLYLAWRRRDGTTAGTLEIGLIAVTLGLEFLPLIWALAIGQTTILLMLLLAGSILLAKRGRDVPAGLLLGAATAIKLTPALLIVYFAWRGRARLAAWGAATFVACSLGAVAALGPAVNVRFYTEIVPMMSGGTVYFLNQSLAALFDRLVSAGDVRQVALASSGAARALAALGSAALLVATAFGFARSRWSGEGRAPDGLGMDLEVSAVLLLTLLISPISWSHHYVLALIPLYSVVAAAGRSGRRSILLAAAFGLAFLLIARKPHFELFMQGPLRLALSASLFGALTLWGGCLVLLRWGPGAPAAGPSEHEVADAS